MDKKTGVARCYRSEFCATRGECRAGVWTAMRAPSTLSQTTSSRGRDVVTGRGMNSTKETDRFVRPWERCLLPARCRRLWFQSFIAINSLAQWSFKRDRFNEFQGLSNYSRICAYSLSSSPSPGIFPSQSWRHTCHTEAATLTPY